MHKTHAISPLYPYASLVVVLVLGICAACYASLQKQNTTFGPTSCPGCGSITLSTTYTTTRTTTISTITGSTTSTVLQTTGPTYTTSVAPLSPFQGECYLYVNSSPQSGGEAGPSNFSAPCGASVPLSEVPEHGYIFTGWQGTGPGGYTGKNAYAILTLQGDNQSTQTYETALFTPECTVTTGVIPPGAGTASTGGQATVACGSTVMISAAPSAGYIFMNWTCFSSVRGSNRCYAGGSPSVSLVTNASYPDVTEVADFAAASSVTMVVSQPILSPNPIDEGSTYSIAVTVSNTPSGAPYSDLFYCKTQAGYCTTGWKWVSSETLTPAQAAQQVQAYNACTNNTGPCLTQGNYSFEGCVSAEVATSTSETYLCGEAMALEVLPIPATTTQPTATTTTAPGVQPCTALKLPFGTTGAASTFKCYTGTQSTYGVYIDTGTAVWSRVRVLNQAGSPVYSGVSAQLCGGIQGSVKVQPQTIITIDVSSGGSGGKCSGNPYAGLT